MTGPTNLSPAEVEEVSALRRQGRGQGALPKDLSKERIPPGYVTGAFIQTTLGISKGEFRSLVKKGFISRAKERRGTFGSILYKKADAEQLFAKVRELYEKDAETQKAAEQIVAKTRPQPDALLPPASQFGVAYTAEQGTDVFQRLHAGERMGDIVRVTGYHPAIVQSIARDYHAFEDEIVIPANVVGKIRMLPLPGDMPVPSRRAAHIYGLLVKLAAERQCKYCPERRPCLNACKHCAAKAFAKAQEAKKAGQAAEEEDVAEGEDAAGAGDEMAPSAA